MNEIHQLVILACSFKSGVMIAVKKIDDRQACGTICVDKPGNVLFKFVVATLHPTWCGLERILRIDDQQGRLLDGNLFVVEQRKPPFSTGNRKPGTLHRE